MRKKRRTEGGEGRQTLNTGRGRGQGGEEERATRGRGLARTELREGKARRTPLTGLVGVSPGRS